MTDEDYDGLDLVILELLLHFRQPHREEGLGDRFSVQRGGKSSERNLSDRRAERFRILLRDDDWNLEELRSLDLRSRPNQRIFGMRRNDRDSANIAPIDERSSGDGMRDMKKGTRGCTGYEETYHLLGGGNHGSVAMNNGAEALLDIAHEERSPSRDQLDHFRHLAEEKQTAARKSNSLLRLERNGAAAVRHLRFRLGRPLRSQRDSSTPSVVSDSRPESICIFSLIRALGRLQTSDARY